MARILTRDEVASVLTMADCIEAVELAQRALSAGEAVMPVRLATHVPSGGVHLSMPAALPGLPALGLKAVTAFPQNPARGEPMIMGVVVLNDPGTGRVLAVMDGAYLTGVRTAAASAVATRALARRDASVLALVGAGVQAATHLEAMVAVRPIREVRVASRTAGSAGRFAREQAPRYPELAIRAVDGPRAAIEGADVVCLVTSSPVPVTERAWIASGCHVNGVGAHTPSTREIDADTMTVARVTCDSRDAALAEKGEAIIPLAEGRFGPQHVTDEIGEVLNGTKPGRTSPEQITVYLSGGLAVQDVATARLVHQRALEQGIGVEIPL